MVNSLSHWPLVVGCMLLLTETRIVSSSVLGTMVLLARTVPVVLIAPTFEEGVVLAKAGAVERKYKPWHYGIIHKKPSLDSFCSSRVSDGDHVQLTKCFYRNFFTFTDNYKLALHIAHSTAFDIRNNHAHNQQTVAAVCSGNNLCLTDYH